MLFWRFGDKDFCFGEVRSTRTSTIHAQPRGDHMREHHPKTQTMNITDFKNQLSSLVNAVYRNEMRVLIEKAGNPVVAVVSADDLERLSRFEQEREERFKVI